MPTPYERDTAPDPTAVKRALRALTTGSAPVLDSDTRPTAESPIPPPTTPSIAVVDRAHEALADVESAAAFVADGGVERLRGAIDTAERTGDRDTARAGQRALATIERYRRAATGDHFHPGRGTVFRCGSQVRSE